MADENRSFAPGAVSSNRAQQKGLGVGQKEMDKQQSPSREADLSGQDVGRREMTPESQLPGAELDDRNAAGLGADNAQLGASTPANVDVHDLGQEDNPQEDWGEPMAEGAVFSSNHTRRGVRTEAERGQGAKTRRMTKDIISRRT